LLAITEDGNLFDFSLLADVEPINGNEALKNEAWKVTITEELTAIGNDNTRKLIKLLADKKAIEVK
jgi:hypothetical protein